MSPADEAGQILDLFGVHSAGKLASFSPIDGKAIGRVTRGEPDLAAAKAAAAFLKWRIVPAPRRGELVRLLGDALREAKPVTAPISAPTPLSIPFSGPPGSCGLGKRMPPIAVDTYYITPNKCTECQGFHEEPQCAAVCPVDCCVPDEMYIETVEELMAKKEKMHL